MLLHRVPTAGVEGEISEELRSTYSALKEAVQEVNEVERQRTLERLRSTLSDQQLNTLTEYQQQTRDRFLEE